MRLILILLLALCCTGCASTRAVNARVDPWLISTGAMPAGGWRAMDKLTFGIAKPARNAFGVPMECTGGTDLLPTRRSTYTRADAISYQRLWVKFGGRPPVPFGVDPQADAGVLAITEAQRAKAAERQ
jgi:hypothetical protein